jgi:large subunit ribosomal protein L21
VRRYIAVRARDQSQENTMYAVVTTGGKQYRVEAGNELTIERLAADAGTSVTFDRVLLVGDGETVTVGTPVVDGATVSATVLGESLGPKLVIFKFKQKVKYRRRTGHRQHLLRVRIDEINAAGRGKSRAKARAEPAEEAKPTEAAAETAAQAPAKPRATRARAAKPKAEAPAKADAAASAKESSVQAEAPKKRTTRRTAAKTAETPADAEKAADEAKE